MRYLLLINMLLLTITSAFASNQNITTLDNENEIAELMGTSKKKLASSDIRKEQKFAVMIGHGIEYTDFTTMLRFDIIQENQIFTLRTSSSSLLRSRPNVNRKEETTAFSGEIKFFVGNSFYLGPKVYYRHYSSERTEEENNWFNGTKKYSYDDLGAGFFLGNQWSFNKFTIGCDWFGINNTLVTLNEKGTSDIFDINEPGVSINLLNFYIGMVF